MKLNCYSVTVNCNAQGNAGRFVVNVVAEQSMRGLIAALHLAIQAHVQKENVNPDLCEAVSISVIAEVNAVDMVALGWPTKEEAAAPAPGTESLISG